MDTANCFRRSVLVTGASSGIGLATAIHLSNMGFRVFAGIRKKIDAERLQHNSNGMITAVQLDITDMVSISSAREFIESQTGGEGLSGLVNNAGIVVAGPLEFFDVEDLRRQLEVNLIGQVAVTQSFLPLIRKAKGRIVFMGSISGRVPYPFMAAYSASKFALEAVADCLRIELMPWDIFVSIVEPGSIATPIWEKSIAAADARIKSFPHRAMELYGTVLPRVRRSAQESARRAIPAARAARAVTHALTSASPKRRYIVGANARIELVLRTLLPARLLDRLISRHIGLR